MKTKTENKKVNPDNFNKKYIDKGSHLSCELSEIFHKFIREEITLVINGYLRKETTMLKNQHTEYSYQTTISSKFGWLKDEAVLLKLHKSLYSHGFIICDYETFELHFFGTSVTTEYIVWHSDTKQLVYLFNQLKEENYIPKIKNPHQLLKEHFLDKSGNRLKEGSLRSSLNNVKNNKRIRVIENIISTLKEV